MIKLQEKKDGIVENEYEKVVEIKINKNFHNIFIYNIQFKNKNGEFSHSPLNSTNTQFPLNFFDELQLYKAVVEIYDIDKILNTSYLYSIFQCFVGNNKKFIFIDYISGLLEYYNSNDIYKYMVSFKYEKICEKGEPKEEQLQIFKEKINEFINDYNIILNKIKKGDDKKKALGILNMIFLYFNFHFQKKKLDSMFKSTDINKDLFKIVKENPDIFPNFFLSKIQIIKIIKISNQLSEIKEILSYTRNCLDFLEILNETKENILNICKIDKKDKKKINESSYIIIDKNAKLKEDDDFSQILQLLESIIKFEIEEDSIFFEISDDFIKKMIEFSNEINYNRLLLIKNTIDNYVKKINKHFKAKDLELSIHQTGMKFINKGKIKAKEILDFIQKDKYYNDKIF